VKTKKNLGEDDILTGETLRPCLAWQRRASTCGYALLPHADKHMFVYVLELCKSEAKRSAGQSLTGHPERKAETLSLEPAYSTTTLSFNNQLY
jgi:hypothetical protein